jgi:N-acetylglucosaminyl-diphospho-decaprenol L-rhamnosyltransferase
MSDWNHRGQRIVDQPAGAFLLLRPQAWGEGEPFDDRFFMFYEDVDLCRRIRQQGYLVWFTDSCSSIHLREVATAQNRSYMAVALARSRILYFRKWHGTPSTFAVGLANIAGSCLRAAAWALLAAEPERRAEASDRSSAHWEAALASGRELARIRTGLRRSKS